MRCVETGVVYASARDAAEILAAQGMMFTPEGISHTCQKRQKTTRGLHWEYVPDDQLGRSAMALTGNVNGSWRSGR